MTPLGPLADRATRAQVGRAGERLAARYMKRKKLRLLGRNVRTPRGEIDLLFEDRRTGALVACEVKSRVGAGGRLPETGLGTNQKKRLIAAIKSEAGRRGMSDRPLRIDFVAVVFASGPKRLGRNGPGDPEIRHHPAAFGAD